MLLLSCQGEFYSISSPSEPPFSPEVFDLPSTEDYMMSVGLSEFFMNSAVYSYFSAELLHIHITDDMVNKRTYTIPHKDFKISSDSTDDGFNEKSMSKNSGNQ